MMCGENLANKETKEIFDRELAIGKQIADRCQRRGMIVRAISHLNVMSPPLILTRSQVDTLLDTPHENIVETTDDLVREGVKIS